MDFCTVELFREKKFAYSGLAFTVKLDGETVCRLRNGENARFLTVPGEHQLCIYSVWGCIGNLILTIQNGQQYEYITILTSSASHHVTFAHGYCEKPSSSQNTAASVLLWIIAVIVLVSLLLYLAGIMRPFVFFFPIQ